MTITVSVKTSAKEEKIIRKSETQYTISVKAPAKEGKANTAVVQAIARHFHIPPSRIVLIKGIRSPHKTIRIKE